MYTSLTIAGSDSSGGAGIQADIKTMSALGVYAMSVITAITAQNTMGVDDILYVDDCMIEKQLESVLSDIPPNSVKIGMLSTASSVEIIAHYLKKYNINNIVVDPVMVATSGDSLTKKDTVEAMSNYIFPMATIITPNIPEAEALTGKEIISHKSMLDIATMLSLSFDTAVLIKGGHSQFCDAFSEMNTDGSDNKLIASCTDILVAPNEKPSFMYAERVDNNNTHGTGCTLSSAIASFLAKGLPLKEAVREAKIYVTGAIKANLNLGHGRGPLNHLYNMSKTQNLTL